jgi:hypothetical protein
MSSVRYCFLVRVCVSDKKKKITRAATRHKNVMGLLTGHAKPPQFSSLGDNKHRTTVTCNGVEHELLLRVTSEDPNPQVGVGVGFTQFSA